MCIFITLMLSHADTMEAAQRIASPFPARLSVLKSKSVDRLMRPDWVAATIVRAECDCGTGIGRANSEYQIDVPSGGIRRRPPSTWSARKRARWYEQREATQKREERIAKDPARLMQPPLPLAEWLALLNALLSDNSIRDIAMLVHMFAGAIATERMRSAGRSRIPLEVLSEETLHQLKWDHVYEFTR